MTKEKVNELFFQNVRELKHWSIAFTSPDVEWFEAKEDLLAFVQKCDEDHLVYEMENKKGDK